MPNYTHDVIVIGAGSAGLGSAGFAGTIGLKVALIDKTAKNYGGDCLNYGCVPSKALLHVAQQFAGAKRATDFGLKTSGRADFGKVMDYVHRRQDVIRVHETPEAFREEHGVDSMVGEAMLVGKNEVSLNGNILSAPRIILCTGSKPRHLKVPGAELVKQYDNESLFWELDVLPEHLLVVGGGPISCEMAQAFVRLGSRVTLLVRGERLLEKDPALAAAPLQQQLEREGVAIRFGTEINSFGSATSAQLSDGSSLDFSHCLVAIGRSVRTQGLGLEMAGVQVKDGKIVTDDYYRTTNKSIYAIGDAYGREMFSHGAEKHNTDLWTNLLSPIDRRHELDHFTWVTFTEPEVASFGKSQQQLDKEGVNYELVSQSLEDDDRAVAADFRDGILLLYLSKKGKILGGCMTAPNAGEIIQELHLMNQLGIDYSKLTQKVYAYPVAARINQKAARARTQERWFTPLTKRAMRLAYRVQNR